MAINQPPEPFVARFLVLRYQAANRYHFEQAGIFERLGLEEEAAKGLCGKQLLKMRPFGVCHKTV